MLSSLPTLAPAQKQQDAFPTASAHQVQWMNEGMNESQVSKDKPQVPLKAVTGDIVLLTMASLAVWRSHIWGTISVLNNKQKSFRGSSFDLREECS